MKRYGAWALVTGASSGIGRACAEVLAAEGYGVVLTARRSERLKEVASDLERRWRAATRVIVQDLAQERFLEALTRQTRDLEIGVLVNNAGFGNTRPFTEQDPSRVAEMIQVNVTAPTLLAHHFAKQMAARRLGLIVMVSSVGGFFPIPYNAVYAATKAYDLMLGEALYGELARQGIDVLSITPAATKTEFFDVEGHPPEVIRRVLAGADEAIDIARLIPRFAGRRHCAGPLIANLVSAAVRVLPRRLSIVIMERLARRRYRIQDTSHAARARS